MTHLKEIIDRVQRKVLEGRVFSVGCDSTTVPDLGYGQMLIRTGVNRLHMVFNVSCSGETFVEVFEGATYSALGTDLTVSNHNRNSTNTSTALFTHAPTITTTGTRFDGRRYIPGGQGPFAGGGGGSQWESELILKPNTVYLVRIQNVSGQTRKVEVHTMYYEPSLPIAL